MLCFYEQKRNAQNSSTKVYQERSMKKGAIDHEKILRDLWVGSWKCFCLISLTRFKSRFNRLMIFFSICFFFRASFNLFCSPSSLLCSAFNFASSIPSCFWDRRLSLALSRRTCLFFTRAFLTSFKELTFMFGASTFSIVIRTTLSRLSLNFTLKNLKIIIQLGNPNKDTPASKPVVETM